MPDDRFRDWLRDELKQTGNGLASYMSSAGVLEKAFGISALPLKGLRDLQAEIAAAPDRSGRNFVLNKGGRQHELNPNVRYMLGHYIRYREQTGARPRRRAAAGSQSSKVGSTARTAPDRGDRDIRRLASRKAVIAAMAELADMTNDEIRRVYRFGSAREYVVRHGAWALPSKAVVGVAFGYQYPDVGALNPDDFHGGKTQAGRLLSRLGFDVDGIARDPKDWTLAEVEFIVATYFEMFRDQRRGDYDRKAHFARAKAKLEPARDKGAIGRKLSNISAILEDLELPVLGGFTGLGNKQTLLTAVVTDWLADHPDEFDGPPARRAAVPPTPEVEVPPPTGAAIATADRERRACKVDFAARDARNRDLGRAGEAWALDLLRAELIAAGRRDLADRTEWVSQTAGDGLGYDITTFTPDGRRRYVEVKTTNQGVRAPFLVSAGEVAASREFGDAFVLLRVFDFAASPGFYRLTGDLAGRCELTPTNYSARPR